MNPLKNNKPLKVAVLLAHLFFAAIFMLQAQSPHVGAIPGEIDISPTGAATYTIPIEVVPGTQGVQPNLSIVYNSMSGMGLLGMKWNLAGLSAITRCGKTPYYDGDITAINFNGTQFALDGNQLIMLNSGTQWIYGAEWATEMENFTRIISHGSNSPLHHNNPPTHFIAYTDDGTIIEYGNTDDSKQIMRKEMLLSPARILSWYINKITDANGNYMTFHYGGGSTKEIWIDTIKYTGNSNSGMPTYAKVIFNYIDLPDTLGKNTYFVSGYAIPQTKLLETITVYYGNDGVRKYQFKYNIEDTGERSTHLKEIILKGEKDLQLNATVVNWGEKDFSIKSNFFGGIGRQEALSGDFNGDGYSDLLLYDVTSEEKGWELMLYDPVNNSLNSTNTGTLSEDDLLFAQDINGDGKDELIIVHKMDGNLYSVKYYTPAQSSNSIALQSIQYLYSIDFGDFDGNGSTDIVFTTLKGTVIKGTWGLQFYKWGENSMVSMATMNNIDVEKSYYLHVIVHDANGDGKKDIELHNDGSSKTKIYQYNGSTFELLFQRDWADSPYCAHYMGDVNGDGITDFIDSDGKVEGRRIYVGKGNGTYLESDVINKLTTSIAIILADLNGDGKDDIIQANYNSSNGKTTLTILISKGWINEEYAYTEKTITVTGNYENKKYISVGDFNGDGILDLFLHRTGLNYGFLVVVNQDNDYEFVKKITDGIGKKIQLNYKYQYQIASSFPEITAKKYFLPLINTLTISNDLNSKLNSWSYQYSNARYSLLRKQFLGFEDFTCINTEANKKDIAEFIVDWSKQILVPFRQTSYFNTNLISEKSYSDSMLKFLPNNRFIFHYGVIEEYDVLTHIATRTDNYLSNDGRLIKTITRTYDGFSSRYPYYIPYPANYMFSNSTAYSYNEISLSGKQKKTVIDSTFSTQQYANNNIVLTDTTTYNYSATGRLNWERQSNSAGSITTTYENYLIPGICKDKTVSAAKLSRKTTCDYDDTRRFTKSIKNELEHETTFIYDAKTGNKTSETDPNGLTTTYKYDAFGNLTRVIYPDKTETNTLAEWFTSPNIPNAKYSITTKNSGKPTVTVYYDILGREVCRLDDGYYYLTHYNAKGQVDSVSYPFSSFKEDKIWSAYTYDIYGRKLTEKAPYTDLKYDYDQRKITVTDKLRKTYSSKDYDALGRIIQAKDSGGTINYEYKLINKDNKKLHQTEISVSGGGTTTILTDQWGNRLSINDPNAGEITSTYTSFNELKTQKDANSNITNYEYDLLGRVKQKKITAPDNTTQTIDYSYDYFDNSNQLKGKLYQIKLNNSIDETFKYDALGRLIYHEKRAGRVNSFQYTYNTNGQLETLTYPDRFEIIYSYDATGKLNEIRNTNDSTLIYKVNSRNKYNQTTNCQYGNNVITEYDYNATGLLTRINTGNKISTSNRMNTKTSSADSTILNYRYAYNNKGLISSRSEGVLNRLETFTYDELDRLNTITAGFIGQQGLTQTFNYANNGNIDYNSRLGDFHYMTNGSKKPHAVTEVVPKQDRLLSENQCDVTYNLFHQPTRITEDGYRIDISYGSNQQRNQMIRRKEGKITSVQYYTSKYHEKINDRSAGAFNTYHYIYGDNGVVAMHLNSYFYVPDTTTTNPDSLIFGGGGGSVHSKGTDVTDSLYYIHTDHLGSYCAITNANKQVRQRNWFDSWGNCFSIFVGKDDPLDSLVHAIDTFFWHEPDPQRGKIAINFTLTNRGFTGHEHYPEFKIINMNGRLYDPVIGRFFSPDKYVANSSFTQDFNRYSYARNNPLKYVDPSGESFLEGFFNFLFAPVRALTEGFEWINDKMNGYGRPGGYFNSSYIWGHTEPGSSTPYNPVNALPYNHPNYIPPTAGVSSIGIGTGWSMGADNRWGNILDRPIIMDPNSKLGKRFTAMFYTEHGLDPDKPIPAEYRNSAVVYVLKNNWFKYAPNPSGGIHVGKYPDILQGHPGATIPDYTKDNKFLTGGSTMYLHDELAFSSLWKLQKTLGHELVHVSQFLALAGLDTRIYKTEIFRTMLDYHAHKFSNLLGGNYWEEDFNLPWATIFPQYYKKTDYKSFAWPYLN